MLSVDGYDKQRATTPRLTKWHTTWQYLAAIPITAQKKDHPTYAAVLYINLIVDL